MRKEKSLKMPFVAFINKSKSNQIKKINKTQIKIVL